MSEADAAAFLNLTVRTLRNYRVKGRLAFREVPGKTRPVIAYAWADLERLKADLERQRRRGKKPKEVRPALPPRVSFGLPPGEYAALCAEADKYGMRPGEYARRLAREGLESRFREEAGEVRAELAKANAEIRKVRHEFSLALEAVLEFVGLSPEEAAKWVTENLR